MSGKFDADELIAQVDAYGPIDYRDEIVALIRVSVGMSKGDTINCLNCIAGEGQHIKCDPLPPWVKCEKALNQIRALLAALPETPDA